MKNNNALILALLVLSTTTAFADYSKVPDFKNSREMADYYSDKIRQRQREQMEELHDYKEQQQLEQIENKLEEMKKELDR